VAKAPASDFAKHREEKPPRAQIKGTSKKGKAFEIDYVNWAVAMDWLYRTYPEAEVAYREWGPEHARVPYVMTGTSAMVHCTIAIPNANGTRRACWFPVMDNSYEAIHDPSSRDISDAQQRAFVKCLGYHGYGLDLWMKGAPGGGGGSAPAQSAAGKCPDCGKPVYERKRKSDGKTFYGCSGFRDGCKWTSDHPPKSGAARKSEDAARPPTEVCQHCGGKMKKMRDEQGIYYQCRECGKHVDG
jgi:predicted RNA-binding Zn-ribbon protein involved in translation (DUF1610 family)